MAKLADHRKFHERWERLQNELSIVLSVAHEESWVRVSHEYEAAIDCAIDKLKSLRKLTKEE